MLTPTANFQHNLDFSDVSLLGSFEIHHELNSRTTLSIGAARTSIFGNPKLLPIASLNYDISENAHDRLSTIAAHTDLGSGMAVAMKDLEIRGAGNLLGGEQSGHIADVGFDLYVRLVSEAVEEVKTVGAAIVEDVVKVELPVDAHLPHSYVPEERLRLEAYRRLADARTNDDVTGVVEELADRYGSMPAPVETLVSIARLRVSLQAVGITEVIATSSHVKFSPVELPESKVLRLNRLYPGSVIKPATRTIVVPRPKGALIGSASQAADIDLVDWVNTWVSSVVASS